MFEKAALELGYGLGDALTKRGGSGLSVDPP